jgi:predicted nucleotidyltransferase
MSQSEVRKIIEKFALELKENNFDFSSIFLFGSYAKGKPHKYSDIDVAVVSKKMKRNYEKNLDKLNDISFKVNDRLEVHAFTPEDFKDGYPPLAHEVKLTGIRIV